MTDIRTGIVDIIGEVDPDNTLDVRELGAILGKRIAPNFTDLYTAEVQRFVIVLDPYRRLSPKGLAHAIVKHFRLDQEI